MNHAQEQQQDQDQVQVAHNAANEIFERLARHARTTATVRMIGIEPCHSRPQTTGYSLRNETVPTVH